MRNSFTGKAALAAFFLSAFFLRTTASFADLTEEEKAQKRLQFNAYVEEELAKAEQAQAAEPVKKGARWHFQIEPSLGYDSNVNLNAEKQAALYRELRAELGFKAARPELPLLGGGQWGMSASIDRVDYHKFKALDYRDSVGKVFVTAKPGLGLTLKAQYELESLYYPEDDQLNFLSHKIRPEILHEITQSFGHYAYSALKFKHYADRRALTETNSSRDEYRSDSGYEAGYGWRIRFGEETLLGLSAAWQRNDSNDIFDRYNDYRGYKAGGYLFRQLCGRASVVGIGGYDFKDYEARKFTDSGLVETDHFFYLGSYLYLDLSKKTQFVLSYLYRQNDSTDPSQEYSGYLATAGVSITL